jgi:hypothetical protein
MGGFVGLGAADSSDGGVEAVKWGMAGPHFHRQCRLVSPTLESKRDPEGTPMNKLPSTSRLFKLGRARARPDSLDAADLGTCFGLEVSLDQCDLVPAEAATTAQRAGGWLRRLASRQRAPA